MQYEEITGIDLLLPDTVDVVSKDKIKAKIEEYKELDKKEFAKQGNFDVEIGVLQELLKEGEGNV